MFARDLENIVALTEMLTTGEEGNRTIHPTFLLLSPAPFDIRPHDPVDISCNNGRSPIAKRGREMREGRYDSAAKCFCILTFFDVFFLLFF